MTEMAPLTGLFSDSPAAEPQTAPASEDRNEKIAREFVRWCFGFDSDFRNSPDVTNLRFWTDKRKIQLRDSDEAAVHRIALKLYAKKLEQALKQPEAGPAPAPTDPPADFQLTAE